ncbi:S1 family peptidase [Azohydromonas sediminis]|uniref:S1 family peptidase n=1 Tax=Azohydromonas sediminis TaxID=2259674 RepID=UPI000E65BC4B|nr:serine protease [Azohydromonas sediminis]
MKLTRRDWLALLAVAAPTLAQADLVAVIARAKPSVVIVGTFNPTDNPRFALKGTGFVAAEGNLVVTNAHVLTPQATARPGEPGTRQVVQVWRGPRQWEMREASVVRVDAARDLALLRVDGTPLPPMALADPASVNEGMSIAFIGFPIGGVLGYAPVTHRGIVSSITTVALPAARPSQLNEAAVRRLSEGPFEIYQLDAVAYPGNSGGPVFNADTGEVVGVISMVMVKGTRESALSSPTGLTYAIPVQFVRELLERR